MESVAEKLFTDPQIGLLVDDEFRIEEKLGSGGMGTVYRAVQRVTERSVAIKVLHPHLCEEPMNKRFRQEAQIISRLSHPNIITVYKCGRLADGSLYIAMEHVQGRTLDSILGPGRAMGVDRALPLMIQMADALAYAHDQKVVHRDIKPENVILTRAGRSEAIKILDFGVAKMVDGNATLTKAGMLCGSPAYMAPEQWQQLHDIDGRVDMYALGCVFYELLVGRPAFRADSVIGYMSAHLQGPPPPPPLEAGAQITALPALGDIVMRCLERDRTARYADAYSLVEALKEAQREHESLRRADTEPPADAPASQPEAAHMPASAPRRTDRRADEGQVAAEEEADRARAARLHALMREFQAREPLPSSAQPVDEPHAARMHLLLVGAGGVLCALLALALVLLR